MEFIFTSGTKLKFSIVFQQYFFYSFIDFTKGATSPAI